MDQTRTSPPASTTARGPRLGLSWPALVVLALLAVPRVVLHDLHVIEEGTFVNALLVFVPVLVWIAVAWIARVPRPFLTLLVVGACYGVFLAVTHQLLWGSAFGGQPPRLGGELADASPATQQLILRVAAAVSGLLTGTVVGAVSGLAAWGLTALTRRQRADGDARA